MNTDKLKFDSAGKFRILCISDIHAGVGYNKKLTSVYLTTLLNKTSPNLVLMLGDIAGPGVIHIETAAQLKEMLTELTAPLTKRNIPWAHVFGNHDDNFGVPNEKAQTVYEEFPLCLSKAGPKELYGAGNYTLTLYGHDGQTPRFNIYAFDSHGSGHGLEETYKMNTYNPFVFDGADMCDRGIDVSQVMWYYGESMRLEKEQGRVCPALAVMHIPITEMGLASLSPEKYDLNGVFEEKVSCQALNSGLFRAGIERGDIKHYCFGHDHNNNFSVKYCGITLSYDGYLSCHACHKAKQLGGRLYELTENLDGSVSIKTEFTGASPLAR